MAANTAFILFYHGNNVYMINGVIEKEVRAIKIMPGANKITRDDWKFIKSNSMHKAPFVSGSLEWVGASPDDVEVAKESTLPKYVLEKEKPRAAIKIIKDTISQEILSEWLELEKRDEVKKQIAEQLKKIIPTDKDFANQK